MVILVSLEFRMGVSNRYFRLTGLGLAVLGVVLLILSIVLGEKFNIALPLVFMVMGAGFIILVIQLRQKWNWAGFLYIPGMLCIAFGLIFLLNVLTQDWNSWAYAWLLLLAAMGMGLLLANREHFWHPLLTQIGWGASLAGIVLFAVFGAIAGGLFIQMIAPIILVAAGLALRWVRLDQLPGTPRPAAPQAAGSPASTQPLVEPLSTRELEVLRLIGAGLSNQQIADQLTVAASTVKTHINNIYGKLGVQTRVQAVQRARELRLLDS